MLLTYAPAPCAFFLLSHAALSGLIDARTWLVDAWLRTFVAYAGGFVLFLLAQYGALLLDRPLLFGEPLLTVLAIQIVVLLAFVAFVHASCYRATGTVSTGLSTWKRAFITAENDVVPLPLTTTSQPRAASLGARSSNTRSVNPVRCGWACHTGLPT